MSDDMKVPPTDTGWIDMEEGQKLLDGHGWVKRASKEKTHECSPPMTQRTVYIPSASLNPDAKGGDMKLAPEPDGDYGDLWRCFCGRLWRVGDACDYGPHAGRCPRGGYHPQANRWRPAMWWQRLRFRGRP
jgi:hypothetical protein